MNQEMNLRSDQEKHDAEVAADIKQSKENTRVLAEEVELRDTLLASINELKTILKNFDTDPAAKVEHGKHIAGTKKIEAYGARIIVHHDGSKIKMDRYYRGASGPMDLQHSELELSFDSNENPILVSTGSIERNLADFSSHYAAHYFVNQWLEYFKEKINLQK